MTRPTDVQILQIDGTRVRVYGLDMAADLLGLKSRTLTRQAREGKLRTVRAYAPQREPNIFQQWLFHAGDVDECARERGCSEAALTVSTDVDLQWREADLARREMSSALREAEAARREELVSMQEQLHERHRISELELQVESLRQQLERERVERIACEEELARVLDILQSTVARRRAAIPASA